jgi:hypothetical protein
MTNQIKPIIVDETPITTTTFKTQGWEKNTETQDGIKFSYWTLVLPKDNPDEDAICMISSANDEWDELGIPKGHYVVEIENLNGLGYCESEEEIEILYRALTGTDLYDE